MSKTVAKQQLCCNFMNHLNAGCSKLEHFKGNYLFVQVSLIVLPK